MFLTILQNCTFSVSVRYRNMNVVSYHQDEIQKPISYKRPFNLSSCNACKCWHNTTYIILKCWSNTIVLKAVLFHCLCFGITLVFLLAAEIRLITEKDSTNIVLYIFCHHLLSPAFYSLPVSWLIEELVD